MRALVGGLVVFALAVTALPATAALRKKKSGVIGFRDKCRKKEAQVDSELVGPRGDPGPAGVSQPRLFLTDANGRRLPGFVSGAGQLAYPLGGVAYTIEVATDGIHEDATFYFDSTDCSGPRLVFTDSSIVRTGQVLGGMLFEPGAPQPECIW